MNRAYIAKVARLTGVPEMWVDDAIQDIEVRMWRAGSRQKIIVKRGAIDAARQYGRHSRAGRSRETGQFPSLREPDRTLPRRQPDSAIVSRDIAESIVDVLTRKAAFLAAWTSATEHQRACFRRAMRGTHAKDHSAFTHAKNLRRKMRRLAAA